MKKPMSANPNRPFTFQMLLEDRELDQLRTNVVTHYKKLTRKGVEDHGGPDSKLQFNRFAAALLVDYLQRRDNRGEPFPYSRTIPKGRIPGKRAHRKRDQ